MVKRIFIVAAAWVLILIWAYRASFALHAAAVDLWQLTQPALGSVVLLKIAVLILLTGAFFLVAHQARHLLPRWPYPYVLAGFLILGSLVLYPRVAGAIRYSQYARAGSKSVAIVLGSRAVEGPWRVDILYSGSPGALKPPRGEAPLSWLGNPRTIERSVELLPIEMDVLVEHLKRRGFFELPIVLDPGPSFSNSVWCILIASDDLAFRRFGRINSAFFDRFEIVWEAADSKANLRLAGSHAR